MKISVIVPIYNCEAYLANCLDSILRQTYNNLEIILIDDGSTDRSLEICKAYSNKDDRIMVWHQDNKGVSAARNQGLKFATGELISFIDSDDTLDFDMYELLVKYMNETGADISHCGYKHIVRDDIRLVNDSKQIYVQDCNQAVEWLLRGLMFSGGLCNKLYKKNILIGLSFNEAVRINEDILFNFMAFRNAKTIVFADYAKYNYVARLGVSACFSTQDDKKLVDRCEVNKCIYETLLYHKPLRDIAANRYIASLNSYYLFCIDNDMKKCNSLKKVVQEIINNNNISKKLKIQFYLICYCSGMYKLVHKMYRKVKKPNWEVTRV